MLMIHNELASCNVLNLIMINHVSSSHHHARSSSRSILKMIRTRGGGASRQLGKGGRKIGALEQALRLAHLLHHRSLQNTTNRQKDHHMSESEKVTDVRELDVSQM